MQSRWFLSSCYYLAKGLEEFMLRKLFFVLWLLVLGGIALIPPKRFADTGVQGTFPEDQVNRYRGKMPERFYDFNAVIGHAEFYAGIDWIERVVPERNETARSGKHRPVEIDVARMLAEWVVASTAFGIVLVVFPTLRRPA